MCPPDLQTVVTLPREIQKVICQQRLTVMLIKWLFHHFHGIHRFKTVNNGRLLAYVTAKCLM